jgi:hypothetical protein
VYRILFQEGPEKRRRKGDKYGEIYRGIEDNELSGTQRQEY